ncbi:MAG: hypothetical protein V7K50_20665 [Nostoc sp.]|uniref:hypothetical protein n=1 Tax=Nostoc sp. TaxID=1180 RepID=UPI002FF53E1C
MGEDSLPLLYETLRERYRRRKSYTIFSWYASTLSNDKDECKKVAIALFHLLLWEY